MTKKVFNTRDDVDRFNRRQEIPKTVKKNRGCSCRSYNKPEWGGDTDEVILPVGDYFKGEQRTVCVDACIADAVLSLWKVGIETVASCCGHNGRSAVANGNPNIVVRHADDVPEAVDILEHNYEGRCFWVIAWAGGSSQ